MLNYKTDLATVYSHEGHSVDAVESVDVEDSIGLQTTKGYDDVYTMEEGEHNNPAMMSDDDDDDDPRFHTLPGILFLGPRRSGKTSIQRVVFQKMSPHETLFRLEATQHIERTVVDHTSLCRFTIWDFPGDYYGGGGGYSTTMNNSAPPNNNKHYPSWFRHDNNSGSPSYRDYNDSEPQHDDPSFLTNSDVSIYSAATALVFVMDAQDEPYDHVLQHFISTISRAVAINPNISIEVFINKVDGELFLSDEAKYDCRRDIMQQVSDELIDAQLDDIASVNYHLVSIYDHSIFEALSRVVQKVIPQYQPTLENLLNTLVRSCAMEKAYLFDVASKLYISTDSSPVDMQTVELCSDMIDVVLDVSGIYGTHHSSANIINNINTPSSVNGLLNKEEEASKRNIISAEDSAIPTSVIADIAAGGAEDDGDKLVSIPNNNNNKETDDEEGEAELIESSAFDDQSSSVIRLSNGMVLYLREVDSMLALVCLIRSENFRKKSLINYNIGCLKKSLKQLVEVVHE